MIWLLQLLIFGRSHAHKWKIIREVPLVDSKGAKYGHRYDLQCEGCGDVKQKDIL